jgi:hypothetical protein
MSKIKFFAGEIPSASVRLAIGVPRTAVTSFAPLLFGKQFPAVVFFRQACARRVGLVEGSVRLNQVIAPIAKQMCRAEPAKAFSHCRAGNPIVIQLAPEAHNWSSVDMWAQGGLGVRA